MIEFEGVKGVAHIFRKFQQACVQYVKKKCKKELHK
jgi:hypothetical protein